MTLETFLEALRQQLSPLPPEERERCIEVYREMILDRMEEGMSEEDAVRSVGTPGQIAQQVLSEVPLGTLIKARVKPQRTLRGWEVALLIIGFPVWFPLLIAAGAVVFGLVLTAYAVLFTLTLIGGCLAVSGPVIAVIGIIQMTNGLVGDGLTLLGGGMALTGIGVLLLIAGCRLIWVFSKAFARLLRSYFLNKHNSNGGQ